MSIGRVGACMWFMRSVATVVLVAQSTLMVSPAVQAAQLATTQQETQQQLARFEREHIGKSLGHAKERLRLLADRPEVSGLRASSERRQLAKQELRAWRTEFDSRKREALAEFDSIGEMIRAKNLPQVIRERQAEAVAKFSGEIQALEGEVDAALSATDDATTRDRADAAFKRLDAHKLGRAQQAFDPNNLPNGVLQPDRTREPKTTTEAFQASLLLAEPGLRLAQTTGFDFSQLPGADNPTYLGATTEVVLNAAIRAKADELQHDPILIYQWVRNNVHWRPSWGAIQDASHTLSAQRGNAFDISGLTIALLRASGIPARYVYGTVDVPVDQFRSWAGGFEHIDAAMEFVASGGIAVRAVTSGGRIVSIRLEHVWVEAAIDFHPSRGTKNRSADSWVPLDPSFKQLQTLPGLDAVQIAGANAQQLAQSFFASGTSNDAEGWATSFNTSILVNAQAQGRTALQNYVEQNLPNASEADILGGRRIIEQSTVLLAAGLPNRVVATGARFAAVPASLQQQITFAFGKDIDGSPLDARTFPWAQLNNKQVTMSFRPATPADEQALRALLPPGEITDVSQLPSSIPAYLIRVVPELKVDGTVLLSGTSTTLGADVNFVFNPRFVGYGSRPNSYMVPAGSYLAVAVVAGSINPSELAANQARLTASKAIIDSNDPGQIGTLTREHLLGDLFHAGLLGYYSQYLKLGAAAGLQQGGHYELAAGLGSFGYEPNVDYFFGTPRRLLPGGGAMNIPIVNVVSKDAATSAGRSDYAMQLGMFASALEHTIPEQLLTSSTRPSEAISAVKALRKASAAGQRIYRITSANQATALPMIHHDSGTMSEIRSALAAGKTVITHTSSVSVPGWTGAGYVILDADTGAGAWKIAGGANGGFLLIFGAVALLLIALLVANPVLAILLLAGALLFAGCGLSMLYEDDRYFDIYSLMAVALIGALLGAAEGIGALAAFLIPTLGLEVPLIVSNLDDKCASGEF